MPYSPTLKARIFSRDSGKCAELIPLPSEEVHHSVGVPLTKLTIVANGKCLLML